MLTRRLFCGCLPLAAAATFASTPSHAQSAECAVYTRERQSSVTPDQALELLMEGNKRFVAGKTVNCDLIAQVKATAGGQAPFAAVVGCMDSRVPPELVFDQRIGDIFSVRIAGNFVNTDMIGSLEFAAKVAGVRAIVVLGHSSCGAIRGAIDKVELGNLTATLANIRPAVDAATATGERTSGNAQFVQAVADANARMAAEMLTGRSPILSEMVQSGELRIVWAMHDVSTGHVVFQG
ncbi:MAG: carbonic anhydrase family protein [Pseudomonadota bacterium]